MANTIDIDPNGDITILLRVISESKAGARATETAPTPISVKVNSICLSLASPVFAAMARRGQSRFMEGDQLENYGTVQISLDGDADAMLIILRALHLQHRNIPATRTTDELYIIALLVDKYDLLQSIVPWTRLWVAPYRKAVYRYPDSEYPSLSVAVESPGYEKWLCISWVLQESDLFTQVSRKLLMGSSLDGDGELVTLEGARYTEGVPDRIISALKGKRIRLIDKIIDTLLDECKKYKDCLSTDAFMCKTTHAIDDGDKSTCDALHLGALIRCLMRANLWPIETQRTADYTVDSMVRLMGFESFGWALEITGPSTIQGGHFTRPHLGDHGKCGSRPTIRDFAQELEKSVIGFTRAEFEPA